MLVCLGFIHTLEIITRMVSEVVNRERLCGTNVFCSAGFRKVGSLRPLEEVPTQSSFVWLFAGNFVYTLEIVARILSPV